MILCVFLVGKRVYICIFRSKVNTFFYMRCHTHTFFSSQHHFFRKKVSLRLYSHAKSGKSWRKIDFPAVLFIFLNRLDGLSLWLRSVNGIKVGIRVAKSARLCGPVQPVAWAYSTSRVSQFNRSRKPIHAVA